MTEVSFAQHGMWVTERMGAGSAYHMPIVICFDGSHAPDPAVLAKACASVVARHPLLGRAVREHDGVPHLVPATRSPSLETGESVEEAVRRPFDLENGPLVRFTLVGDTLVIVAHHLVFDGGSKDILVADLAAFAAGAVPPPLEPLDHAAGQRERVADLLGEARAFWADRWREPDETVVPGGVLRSRGGGPGRLLEFTLDVPDLSGLTRFEVLHAALHALLMSYGNADVVTAVDLSTRTAESAGHVGPFVNELAVFSSPSPDAPFATFAAGLRAELRSLYAYREVPLARAVAGLRPHAALAPVSVSYRRAPATYGAGPAEGFGQVDWLAFNHAVRGALQLQVLDPADPADPADRTDGSDGAAVTAPGMTASLRYDPGELTDPVGFADDLRAVLAAIAQDPTRSLEMLPTREPVVAWPVPSSMTAGAVPAVEDTVDTGAGVDLDDPLAAEIRAIWEEVLKLAPIEPNDDIFELGGHSLTITQIIARMRKRLGVEVELDDFFDNPTIAGVLQVIRR
ncbi:condensation domain-containing protein [Microbispora sp. CA-102843]|uniref:condensation domain-containing protein n=1 Tax=Microbispora sp. CA-102843 TaxID=3239952 RepID=UPI003D927A7F